MASQIQVLNYNIKEPVRNLKVELLLFSHSHTYPLQCFHLAQLHILQFDINAGI